MENNMTRVWFNHWFSTSYGIIRLMKEDKEVCVIGSNRVVNSVISQACDEWYEEPDLDGEEYLRFCLSFCREHGIDVMVPRRKMLDISRNADRFLEAGVQIMADSYELLCVLNNKARTYEALREEDGIFVPDFEVVTDIGGFDKAIETLGERFPGLCVKFVEDEGARSFRILEKGRSPFQALFSYPGARMNAEDLRKALGERDSFPELMVMPYLPGNEISVDCLRTAKGLIAVPRYKGPSRDEEIRFDQNILEMCEKILKVFPLRHPCNIQFRLLDGVPYLLEVNTRMSGGIQMSCLGAGINIPDIALKQLLGAEPEWTLRREKCIVSYVEIPKLIMR